MSAGRLVADWRDAGNYAWLAGCGRAAFAWEWLRRRSDYARGGQAVAARFGLHRWEDANDDARVARPLWRADADPFVLTATVEPCAEGAGNFDLACMREPACSIAGDCAEHWLFGCAAKPLRLDIAAGTLRHGPVALAVHLAQLAPPALAALDRLLALVRAGEWRRGHFPAERRARRWALVLRVHDALADGARQRDIADCLFGTAGIAHWRVEAASWRRRTQRLVEGARCAAAAEPAAWLDRTFP
ncbi:MAG TPA: DUF2285 domain-containing protein [Sphingopyxis sp.]|nr:DUF2285 domain-containing protein [Sphingopyxis sp.]HMP43828.1 DUF2285 domain-containing protein [Sphingopyxis sp.]HMQ18885.1 DUF2285 domain-containing protein [Sphingopyxis sp.]